MAHQPIPKSKLSLQSDAKDIVFISALRTAIGKFKGIWSELQAHDLGKVVITNILHQSEIEPKSEINCPYNAMTNALLNQGRKANDIQDYQVYFKINLQIDLMFKFILYFDSHLQHLLHDF